MYAANQHPVRLYSCHRKIKRIADYGLGVVMQYSLYVVIKCRINKMLGEK